MSRPLSRVFYARNTLLVARELLGSVLARRVSADLVLRARIVETEAYVGEQDKACHARAGRTPRTEPLYGPPGRAYVYLTYGMHYLLNAVTEPEGSPAAVLIRAAEPVEGVDWMMEARGAQTIRFLTAGPARLTEAFGLDLRHNRADLRGPELWIEPGQPFPDRAVATSPRIGCQSADSPWDRMPWRFYVEGNPFVTPGRNFARDRGEREPGVTTAPGARSTSRGKTRGGKQGRHRG